MYSYARLTMLLFKALYICNSILVFRHLPLYNTVVLMRHYTFYLPYLTLLSDCIANNINVCKPYENEPKLMESLNKMLICVGPFTLNYVVQN